MKFRKFCGFSAAAVLLAAMITGCGTTTIDRIDTGSATAEPDVSAAETEEPVTEEPTQPAAED